MTPEEIKNEMRKIEIPWFVKFTNKFWLKIGRYILFFGMLSMIPLGILYNSANSYNTADLLWNVMFGWFLFLLIGIGGLMLISHIVKTLFIKKQSKRLGISVLAWNQYAKDINLTSF